jgi:hypothetical protein
MDMDMESGGRAPAADPQNFLIGERNSASPVRHRSFPFGRLAVSQWHCGRPAELPRARRRIKTQSSNGPDLAAPDMNDQMAMSSDDTVAVAVAICRTAFMPFFNRIRITPSLSLISLLAEATDSRFPPLLVFGS